MIEIMKASAGSGKTFNLAKNYIKILLRSASQPDAYRHILAVTFTNKATDEMKTRILRELYILAKDPERSDFRKFFVSSEGGDEKPLCRNEAELQKLSATLLSRILHDYSSFCVSTIDKFFQRTLKSFAREIGHASSYSVELDRNSLISESVDRVLDSLTEDDKKTIDWLAQGAMSQLEDGKRYNLVEKLTTAARRLKDFSHNAAVHSLGIDEGQAYSMEHIQAVEELCEGIIDDFAAGVSSVVENFAAALRSNGWGKEDFYIYFYTALTSGKFATFHRGEPFEMGGTLEKFVIDRSIAFKKSDKNAAAKASALTEIFDEIQELCSVKAKEYSTALAIKSALHEFALAGELYREFDALCKEKNLISLTDSDEILRDIINGSDTPFIYEKMGVRLENFLLDEFQDTSRVQWENMWPLLRDSQSHESYHGDADTYSLIVGDVKQSIYRWRGSDWGLLKDEVGRRLSQVQIPASLSPLKQNFRSHENIVRFNNEFFPFAAGALDHQLEGLDACLAGQDVLSTIYEDVEQEVKVGGQKGSVDLSFVAAEDLGLRVAQAVNEARQAGAAPGEIAVLVRENKLGALVASALIERGLAVVTNDSLRIRSSAAVRTLVAYLTLLARPDDAISLFLTGEEAPVIPQDCHSIIDECYFFLRRMEARQKGLLKANTLYIQSFLDIVQDYISSNGNNLKGFLDSWADNDTSISSSNADNAVTVITIHKSKGLEFPYVIYAYQPRPMELSIKRGSTFWCRPASEETSLAGLSKEVFDVALSSGSLGTMFAQDYLQEMTRLYVDIINVFYVAFTRPSKGLHIISALPSGGMGAVTKKVMEIDSGKPDKRHSSFLTLLYSFVKNRPDLFRSVDVEPEGEREYFRYRMGEMYDFSSDAKEAHKEKIRPAEVPMSKEITFETYPLNPVLDNAETPLPLSIDGLCSVGRLRFRSDSADFFSEDGSVGVKASARLKGTVLHGILASVKVPSDLDEAIVAAVSTGDLTQEQGSMAKSFLAAQIDSVATYGWFPSDSSSVKNEVSLIDVDGSILRPDRVIIDGSSVVIVDYKFGSPRPHYRRQISQYADLYRSLGYEQVLAYLWYVGREVCQVR